jgi:hypothetical protein
MGVAYLAITVVFASIVAFSGIGKLRRDRHIVRVVHEVVGVPLRYLPWLAGCELAGALGLIIGIWWPWLGVAAGSGLAIYFLGAVVSHVRVGDWKGIGPALFLLFLAVGALALRLRTMGSL